MLRLLIGVSSVALFLVSPVDGQELPTPTETTGPQFTRVASVRELPDGSVLIADRGERRIYHVRWGQSEIREVMREGEGPGEFRSVGRVLPLPGDSSLFVDGYHSRWTLLDGVDVVQTFSEQRQLNRELGSRIGGLADSLVLGWPDPGRQDVDSVPLLLGDWQTGEYREIARLAPISRGGFTMIPASGQRPASMVGGNPLGGADLAVLADDGWVGIARGQPYRVEWRRPDGAWVTGDPLPFDPVEVDRTERCFAVERYLPHDCDEVDLPGWPDVVPPFLPPGIMPDIELPVVLPTPDRHLIIARAPTRHTGSEATTYDVVDRDGRLVRKLTLTEGRRIVGFGAASVFVIGTNDLGLQTIDRHPWPDAQRDP